MSTIARPVGTTFRRGLVLAMALGCCSAGEASPNRHKPATVGRAGRCQERPPSLPGTADGGGFVGRPEIGMLAQLQFGEDVGNLDTETMIVTGEEELEPPGWQRQIEAYREATGAAEDRKLKLTIVPWFNPSKGIERMIQRITPLDEKGEPHGEVHSFRPLVRQPVHAVTYRHGIRHGLEQQWEGAHQGKTYLRAKIPWQNGQVHGERIMYHPGGEVMTITRYNRGKETGESRSFDAQGRLERAVTYRNGNKHGELRDIWPQTGKPRRIIPYRNGKVDGVVQEFYPNGKKKREVTLKNNAMHGVERVYNEEGKEIETRYWIDGERVGEARFKEEFKK